jgi:hypothetical protein
MDIPQNIRRILVYSLGVLGVLTFASAIISYECVRSYGPRQANVETGQIYPKRMQQPFNVYLTKVQMDYIAYGPVVGGALGFSAGLLNLRWKIIHNPYYDRPRKLY